MEDPNLIVADINDFMPTPNSECSACFETVTPHDAIQCLGHAKYRVADNECRFTLCPDCFQDMQKLMTRERTLAVCPNCKSLYPPNMPGQHQNFVSWIESANEKLLNVMNMRQILQNVVERRNQYLVSNFPLAVQTTVNIMYPKRLLSISAKQRQHIVDMMVNCDNGHCIREYCRGGTYVNKDTGRLRCFVCSCEQCIECKEEWKADHVCDPNVLKNLELLAEFIQCPGCLTRVQKSEGCNSMTCAKCNTNFTYNDGLKGGGGNHGQNKEIRKLDVKDILREKAPEGIVEKLVRNWTVASVFSDMSSSVMRESLKSKNIDVMAMYYRQAGSNMVLDRIGRLLDGTLKGESPYQVLGWCRSVAKAYGINFKDPIKAPAADNPNNKKPRDFNKNRH